MMKYYRNRQSPGVVASASDRQTLEYFEDQVRMGTWEPLIPSSEVGVVNNKEPRWARCSVCGYRWPKGQDGSHNCATKLIHRLAEAKFLMAQVLSALPSNRDWLDPNLERMMRGFTEKE